MIFSGYNKHVMQVILGIIAIGFIALTILIILFPHPFIDQEFSHEIQSYQNPTLDIAMRAISWFGYYPGNTITVLVAAALFLVFKYRKEALYVLLTSISGLISSVTKALVNRPRPTESLVRIVRKVSEQSFPSGHVLFYVVFFGFLAVLMDRIITIPKWVRIVVGFGSLLLILIVPFSRIYLGAHWFTDVLGGFLLGMLCLYLLCYFYFGKHVR